MGYTHYWYRQIEIDRDTMLRIVTDFKKMLPILAKYKIYLSGPHGTGEAIINIKLISFNGPRDCGHTKNEDISIPWPSENAAGVAGGFDDNKRAGDWFAGAIIDNRCCNGDCSYETFYFPAIMEARDCYMDRPDGLEFNFCKTAYRPYDLAVNVFLIIAKHHLKDRIKVSSDGEMNHWKEAMWLCEMNLGYGLKFNLKGGE